MSVLITGDNAISPGGAEPEPLCFERARAVLHEGMTICATDAESWSSDISRSFVPLTAEPFGAPFSSRFHQISRGPFKVSWIEGSAQRVVRGKREQARTSRSEVYLNVQLAGTGKVHASGEVVSTTPGKAALVSSAQPFDLTFDQTFAQLCVSMPMDWVATRIAVSPDAIPGHQIDFATPVGGIVGAALQATVAAHDAAEQDACSDLFGRALQTVLYRDGLEPDVGADPRLIARIKGLISERFGDPTLTPTKAAASIGCSISTLHFHCQQSGRSFGTMLQETRLQAAAAALRRTPDGRRQVGAIAYACGFADPSHFSRLFKARFETTPTAYR